MYTDKYLKLFGIIIPMSYAQKWSHCYWQTADEEYSITTILPSLSEGGVLSLIAKGGAKD